VKSLSHYPSVLTWMDENLSWTKQLGEVFAAQPADVMNAIQRLRARARASGALMDTPQQQIIAQPDVIRIVPAQPDVIYVPQYDPQIVFIDRPMYYAQPAIFFGVGCGVGPWLAYDFDWSRRSLWIGDRHRRWSGRPDWQRPMVGPIPSTHISASYAPNRTLRQWQPPVRPSRPAFDGARTNSRDAFTAAATSQHSPMGPLPPSRGAEANRSLTTGAAGRGFSGRGPVSNPAWNQPAPATLVAPTGPQPVPGYRGQENNRALTTTRRAAPENITTPSWTPSPAPAITTPAAPTPTPPPSYRTRSPDSTRNLDPNGNYRTRSAPPVTMGPMPSFPSAEAATPIRQYPSYVAPAAAPQNYSQPAPATTWRQQSNPQHYSPPPPPAPIAAPAPAASTPPPPANVSENRHRSGRVDPER
jgi:hypothetical protein